MLGFDMLGRCVVRKRRRRRTKRKRRSLRLGSATVVDLDVDLSRNLPSIPLDHMSPGFPSVATPSTSKHRQTGRFGIQRHVADFSSTTAQGPNPAVMTAAPARIAAWPAYSARLGFSLKGVGFKVRLYAGRCGSVPCRLGKDLSVSTSLSSSQATRELPQTLGTCFDENSHIRACWVRSCSEAAECCCFFNVAKIGTFGACDQLGVLVLKAQFSALQRPAVGR